MFPSGWTGRPEFRLASPEPRRTRTRIVMTDKKNPGETLTVTPTKTLTLKRPGVEQGMVRQSFIHGRTKGGVGEKVRRRGGGRGGGKAEPAPPAARAAPPVRRTPISGRAAPTVAS